MSALLARTRAALGAAPRQIDVWDHLEPPRWMKADDPLRASYARRRDLLTSGDVVWGHVVQANTLLFKPGDKSSGACVVFGARADDDLGPDQLERAAAAIYALKGKEPQDAGLARVAAAVTDEMARYPPMDLPSAVTRGVAMRIGIVMVHRPADLPCAYLATTALPLVVSRARDELMVLPVRHWAKDLSDAWRDLGARAT